MKIKFIATSDVHGYPCPYQYSNQKLVNQGLSRLAQFIRTNNDENCVLIDNGDILQGSPLSYHHHLFLEDQINPMALCLNELKYDYFNIGNHDFNYHQDVLIKFLNDIDAKCITGNITGNKNLEYQYDIKTVNGYKLAFIGATNDYIPNWEIPNHIIGLQFEDSYEYVKRTIEYIKNNEKVDFTVVVYHGGFECLFDGQKLETPCLDNCGYKMLENLDIDLFITGHQHRSICEFVHNTFVVQTASNAQELAYVELDPISKTFSGKLVKAEFDIDQKIIDLVKDEEAMTQIWLDQPIGTLKDCDCLISDDIDARINKHRCVSFLNQVQASHYKSDLSAMALFNNPAGFRKEITMRDVVSTYVYPNTLVNYEVNGLQLKKYLENAVAYFDIIDDEIGVSKIYCEPKPIHYEYDMVDGIEYTIKVSNPVGSRIIEIKKDGKIVNDDDLFSMVVNNYRSAGGGNYNILKECKIIDNDGKEMVEIIAEYIMKNSPVEIIHHSNIKLIK